MGVLFNDVVINKLSGGLGRRTPDRDMVSGLLYGVKSNSAEVSVDQEPIRLTSIEDAEKNGITSKDDRQGNSVHYQISQFFRVNPSGDLWVMGLNASDFATLAGEANRLLEAANGEIRQLAVIHSDKDTSFEDVTGTTGAVGKAADITKNAFEKYHRPLEIFIEGKGFGDFKEAGAEPPSTGEPKTLIDLAELEAPNVSIVVAMDKEKAQKNNYSNTAAVGVLLGAVSRAKVSENIAWIEKFNLTGDGFRSVGFVGGKDLESDGVMTTLNEKRYIFTRSHIGIPGLYFNDSHTCTQLTSDFAYIEANRTINKAARIARTALLPKVNSPVLVDPDTGTLPPSVVKGYEILCKSALERMISNEEVSEIDVFVDPNQNILADSILKIKIEVVPMGTARRIEVNLGFKNPFGLNA